ncbi:dihydrofolate reductase family protein [Agromyces sp. Soil535]|uniref:dihydrofolate reductase family protein n=1 Tax=Agromyces sp. Soil535 TaxID=1736390 RepID=UPI0006FC519A|nr:dihydrofolate reductase family protein [Agromyces sp. Soil535]KRE31008.1 deaminase [Agromyces sp. Soil535]
MGSLICTGITSLDGYIADEHGDFSWGVPDAAEHTFVNDLERPVGTYLYGRRMYDVMRFWETADGMPDLPEAERDYAAIWQAADKVVYSSTLADTPTRRTRLERSFDADAVRRMKAESVRDLSISGPGLAVHAFRAGLVDEVRMLLHPVVLGGGTSFLPDGVRLDLELLDERRFGNGVVFLRYAVLESR